MRYSMVHSPESTQPVLQLQRQMKAQRLSSNCSSRRSRRRREGSRYWASPADEGAEKEAVTVDADGPRPLLAPPSPASAPCHPSVTWPPQRLGRGQICIGPLWIPSSIIRLLLQTHSHNTSSSQIPVGTMPKWVTTQLGVQELCLTFYK